MTYLGYKNLGDGMLVLDRASPALSREIQNACLVTYRIVACVYEQYGSLHSATTRVQRPKVLEN